jgi:DNA-binding PadR family transcriptional regulator
MPGNLQGRRKLSNIQRRDLLLTLLLAKGANAEHEPLDRIRAMKSLFLLSQEEKSLSQKFRFEPYLYGAVSFDVYRELDALQFDGLVTTTKEFTNENWNRYCLTSKGIAEAKKSIRRVPRTILNRIERVKKYTTSKQMYELLKEVYAKYPSFATKSVVRITES